MLLRMSIKSRTVRGTISRRKKMSNELNSFKKNLGRRWVKARSGNTYVCPVDFAKNFPDASEEELRRYCVEESLNPQND